MTVIQTDEAPFAVGTYSQGTVTGDRILTAGQIGLHPDSGELLSENFTTEAQRALDNVLAIVREGGGSKDTVLTTGVYLTDLDHYETLNDVYEATFSPPYPPRSVVEVCSLPKNARVEIEAEATVSS